MDLKQLVDVSSFFLVEASGDSEADLFDTMFVIHDGNASIEDDHDDDDAESCCCDSCDVVYGDGYVSIDEDDKDEQVDQHGKGKKRIFDKSWSWHEDFDDIGVDSMQRDENGQFVQVRVDSNEDEMSEEEKNRLFWESCIEHGY